MVASSVYFCIQSSIGDEQLVTSTGSKHQTIGSRLGRAGAAYLDVVRSPTYFPLWLGQLVSTFGDTLHYIALVVLVFQLTGLGLAVAALVAAEVLPVLFLGPVAGVVIDRVSRKAVLIGSDVVRAGLVLSLLWPQGAWHTYLVAAGLAAGNTFFNPTVQAVIPTITTDEQRLAATPGGSRSVDASSEAGANG
jgi:MFS family permease